MKSSLVKAALVIGSLLLSACSGVTTSNNSACETLSCQQHYNSSARVSQQNGSMNSNLGSSFSEYGASMLRD
ncbi:hypothetical protein CCU68_12435 [Pseudomonas gingeri NCPPB 3146 = LMG 5327]|uniref:Lipoprotein n=2 Tax=Pseudomonas gingeri TaxID=117681 RepID=A0A7Y8CC53_9PSED|nr:MULTISPECIES: hypothetical protein [Pseudomonas]NVZ29222.1 hypothetical protein [Pseudomonas gingeri]NVZ64807.1 hypothetical protein [Pseudomonas gingeri]NVZ77034.1 hypothetical protein [Pseudomonas gingeri]NWA08942.1 hypothetical protein [Pseudomonas gingeri]NWC12551.1 hypothetical protein [Pseudomonas gingeri]